MNKMTATCRRRPGGLSLYCIIAVLFCGVAPAQQPAADGAQTPPVTGLVPDHAALSVENIDQESEWYQRVLGFKVFSKFVTPDHISMVHLVIAGYRIDLIKVPGSKRPAPTDPLWMQQGWIHVVFHVDDVAAALKALQALHVEVSVTKDDKGTPIQIRIRDPEGNEIEIRRNLVV
jgi:catechol 2,3-dioxygenase-like lactoylglutathione lyase family enzyme